MSLLERQGHRLLQVGVGLLLFISFEGFVIPFFAAPHLGRSVHTLSTFLAILLLALGLMWPRLRLGRRASAIAFWCLLYSGLAIDLAFVMGAIWGAGATTMPIAAAGAQGSRVQELAIMVVSYSSAAPGIVSFALILWGLRLGKAEPDVAHESAFG